MTSAHFDSDDVDIPQDVLDEMKTMKSYWGNEKDPHKLRHFLLEIETKMSALLPSSVKKQPELYDIMLGKIVMAKLKGEALKYMYGLPKREKHSFFFLSRNLKDVFETQFSSEAIRNKLHVLRQKDSQKVGRLKLEIIYWVQRYIESSEREGTLRMPSEWLIIGKFLLQTTFLNALKHEIYKNLGMDMNKLDFQGLVKRAMEVETRLFYINQRKNSPKTCKMQHFTKLRVKSQVEQSRSAVISLNQQRQYVKNVKNNEIKAYLHKKKMKRRKNNTFLSKCRKVTVISPKDATPTAHMELRKCPIIAPTTVTERNCTVKNDTLRYNLESFDPSVPPPSYKVHENVPSEMPDVFLETFDPSVPPPAYLKHQEASYDMVDVSIPPPMLLNKSVQLKTMPGVAGTINGRVESVIQDVRCEKSPLQQFPPPRTAIDSYIQVPVKIWEQSQTIKLQKTTSGMKSQTDWLRTAYVAALYIWSSLLFKRKLGSHRDCNFIGNQVMISNYLV